jgi:hypothetical protein
MKKGKNFILTHNPDNATGFFLKEINFLKKKSYYFYKDGAVWKSIK